MIPHLLFLAGLLQAAAHPIARADPDDPNDDGGTQPVPQGSGWVIAVIVVVVFVILGVVAIVVWVHIRQRRRKRAREQRAAARTARRRQTQRSPSSASSSTASSDESVVLEPLPADDPKAKRPAKVSTKAARPVPSRGASAGHAHKPRR
ncbi:hypothetical protein C8Q72DRAFT_18988 [Fomitopsis betulina]|nr:hypothetical protein C8Q72DRAFT_516816 [Fomitopsis betulina]KAI0736703.1 hypothetical protein C8Q72DRAFT_18988 [Fomitopsis betulina]